MTIVSGTILEYQKKLKPCPFCGNENISIDLDESFYIRVGCDCGATIILNFISQEKGDFFKEEVNHCNVLVNTWNKRTDIPMISQ